MSYYISLASFNSSPRFDVENYTINGVIMAQVGEAGGYGIHIELEFLQQAVDDINKRFGSKGLPSECDHNFSNGMGKQLGVFKNVRLEGSKMLGDLSIYKSANLSPTHPGLADWFMSMSQEDKRAINSSIKFKHAGYYQKDKEGNKVFIWFRDKELGWISRNEKLGKVYFALDQMKKCDMVTDGALTDKLFSSDSMTNQFRDIVFHPEFIPMLENSADEFPHLIEFFEKKGEKSFMDKVKNFLNPNNKTTSINPNNSNMSENNTGNKLPKSVDEQLAALSKKIDDQTAEIAELKKANSDEAELSDSERIKELQSKITELNSTIAALKKQDSDEPTTDITDEAELDNEETPLYMQFAIHEEAKSKGIGVDRKK